MASINNLSDAELRQKLLQHGVDAPVTATSRGFLIRKLEGLLQGNSQQPKTPKRKSESAASLQSRSTASSSNESPRRNNEDEGSPRVPSKHRHTIGINLNLEDVSAASVGKRNLIAAINQGTKGQEKQPAPVSASPRRKSPGRLPTANTNASASSNSRGSPSLSRKSLREPPSELSHTNGSSLDSGSRYSTPVYRNNNDDYDEEVEESDPVPSSTSRMGTGTISSPSSSAYRRRTIGSGIFSTPISSPVTSPTNNNSVNSTSHTGRISISNTESPIRNMKRYSTYLNYFREGDSTGGGDFLSELENRRLFPSTSSSSMTASPRRTTAFNIVSNISEDEDDDDDEDESSIKESRIKTLASSLNPLNWFRSKKSVADEEVIPSSEPVVPPRTSSSSSNRYSAAHRYSTGRGNNSYSAGTGPGTPFASPVPPSVTIRRPIRERNGVPSSNVHSNETVDESGGSHVISSIILTVFLLAMSLLVFCYLWQTNQAAFPALSGFSYASNSKNMDSRSASDKVETRPPLKKAPIKSSYPVCGVDGVDINACIKKEHAKSAKVMFTALHKELLDRARWVGCGTDVKEKVNLQTARALLYSLTNLRKSEVNEAFYGMLLLAVENPGWGLKLEYPDLPETEIGPLDAMSLSLDKVMVFASDGVPSFFCSFWAWLSTVLNYSILALLGGVCVLIIWKAVQYRKNLKTRSEKEMFQLIEQVLERLQEHYELNKAAGEPEFLAVNHIRDDLIAPHDRIKKAPLWNKVVDYIVSNESRIREEIQHIRGEEYRVWRWIPSTSPTSQRKSMSNRHSSPNITRQSIDNNTSRSDLYPDLTMDLNETIGHSPTTKWQGQAFEIQEGSPNTLPVTPTTCLKIRHLYDHNVKESVEAGQKKIEKSILEKCPGSNILHIGVDFLSREGCVYVKCHTKEDARKVYLAIHGWWFDGHLLSVKFLREERYFERFPEAKKCVKPMKLSS